MGAQHPRVVLVGEAPGGTGKQRGPALDVHVGAGKRFAELAGFTPDEYLARFERTNLFHTPDEGLAWSRERARLVARALIPNFLHDDRVMLLGARVADAFGLADLPLYEWISAQRVMTGAVFWLARVPHPSGRNRVFNDPQERDRFRHFVRATVA